MPCRELGGIKCRSSLLSQLGAEHPLADSNIWQVINRIEEIDCYKTKYQFERKRHCQVFHDCLSYI